MRATRGLLAAALLSLIGLGLCDYLVFLHLGLMRGELLGGPACSAGAFNCHAVTSGPWGSFLGMPLALWGVLGYVAVFALAVWGSLAAETAGAAVSLILLLASAFVAVDLFLLVVQAAVIRFFCLFCLLTYAVNLCLLAVGLRASPGSWLSALRQTGSALAALIPSRAHPTAIVFWSLLLMGGAGVAGVHAGTLFVSRGAFGSVKRQIRDFLQKQPRVAVDVSGDPAVGPAGAPLQLVEFSDFFCPACQRASKLNTVILAGHRRDAAFVFKHYPLDTACNPQINRMVHPGACRVAAASECAHDQGQFWPFHDLLFAQGSHYDLANLERDAARLGLDAPRFRACLESGGAMDAVRRDIAEGAKVGVASTPTYIINGIPLTGGINPAMFEDLVAVLRESAR